MHCSTFLGARDLIMHLDLNRITLATISSESLNIFIDYD